MADPVRVFISYSSKDRAIVNQLRKDLEQAGVEVWFDHENLKPGTPNWTAAVRRGIQEATDVIYAASPDAADSVYVGHELAIARDEGNEDHILPFWVRGEKWSRCVPFGYYYTQYTDGRDAAYASGLSKLLDTLGVTSDAVQHSDTVLTGSHSIAPQQLSEMLLRQFAEAKAMPNVHPIGARFGAMDDIKRLIATTTHAITVENAGGSAVSQIFAVLFPSVNYVNHLGLSECDPPLLGTYWQGRVGMGLMPGMRCEVPLEETRWPLMGSLHVTPQMALYAPEQPSPAERRVGHAHFYSARLTITCRSSSGIRFATAFDLDADHLAQNRGDIWEQILLPTIVDQELRELTAEWEKKRQPHVLGS